MDTTAQKKFLDSTGLALKVGDRIVNIDTGGQYNVVQVDVDKVWIELSGATYPMYESDRVVIIERCKEG